MTYQSLLLPIGWPPRCERKNGKWLTAPHAKKERNGSDDSYTRLIHAHPLGFAQGPDTPTTKVPISPSRETGKRGGRRWGSHQRSSVWPRSCSGRSSAVPAARGLRTSP